jgi:deoxycytidylate deaminase
MTNPSCDRHRNVQMIPFTSRGKIDGHICPVPTCRRRHIDDRYLEIAELAKERSQQVRRKVTRKQHMVREQILKVIRAWQ